MARVWALLAFLCLTFSIEANASGGTARIENGYLYVKCSTCSSYRYVWSSVKTFDVDGDALAFTTNDNYIYVLGDLEAGSPRYLWSDVKSFAFSATSLAFVTTSDYL